MSNAAREKQRCHVRTGNEQEHGRTKGQQYDAVARLTCYVVPQRHDLDSSAACRVRVFLRVEASNDIHLGLCLRESHIWPQSCHDVEPSVSRARIGQLGYRNELRHPEVNRVNDIGVPDLEVGLERGELDRCRRCAYNLVLGGTGAREVQDV